VIAVGPALAGLSPFWVAAAAAGALLLANGARRRTGRARRPSVDQVRSLVVSVASMLLAVLGLAMVAPALVAQLQSRLGH